MLKLIILAAWAIGIASFVVDFPYAHYVRIGTIGLAAAHLLEFVIFSGKLKKAGGSMVSHFINTFLFGLVHIQSVDKK